MSASSGLDAVSGNGFASAIELSWGSGSAAIARAR